MAICEALRERLAPHEVGPVLAALTDYGAIRWTRSDRDPVVILRKLDLDWRERERREHREAVAARRREAAFAREEIRRRVEDVLAGGLATMADLEIETGLPPRKIANVLSALASAGQLERAYRLRRRRVEA